MGARVFRPGVFESGKGTEPTPMSWSTDPAAGRQTRAPNPTLRYAIFQKVNKTILVIGGGIAGLSAALELLREGCAVTLLEAKDRFGGRIQTIQSGSLPVELGAEFVHGRSKPLLGVIGAAGLSLQSVALGNQLFENGKLEEVDLWDRIGEIINRVKPREPDCSFREFLDAKKLDPRSRRLATGFVEGFDAADTERISAHALLRAQQASEQM